jgi:hypothetical protein
MALAPPPVNDDLFAAAVRQRRGGRGRRALGNLGLLLIAAAVSLLATFGLSTLRRPAPVEAERAATAPAPSAPASVRAGAPVEEFPVQAASAFAVQFANDYLSWDEQLPHVREAALAAYLPADADRRLGWSGQGAQIAVLVVVVDVEVVDPTQALVTVAAEITGAEGGRWVHLAVPVGRDERGRLVVTSAPALVPAPAPGQAPPVPPVDSDEETANALRPLLATFFRAFADGDREQLAAVTSDKAARAGLDGVVAFDALGHVTVARGGSRRDATAQVRWRDDVTGSLFTQDYRLVVVRTGDDWWVAELGAGPLPGD